MKYLVRFGAVSVVALLSFILVACGGGSSEKSESQESGGTVFELTADAVTFKYDITTLTTKAGAPVKLTLNNPAAVEHNWLLVKGDETVAAKVSDAGMAAGPDKDYLPDDTSNIIAKTKLVPINGGSETIEFTAPSAGTYIYLCSVSGHYAGGMKGTLTVNP